MVASSNVKVTPPAAHPVQPLQERRLAGRKSTSASLVFQPSGQLGSGSDRLGSFQQGQPGPLQPGRRFEAAKILYGFGYTTELQELLTLLESENDSVSLL